MKDVITTLIPRYGELNRIYKDWSDNKGFSFEKQKFITKFYLDYNDVTVLETAILELVFHLPQEQYTLILNSLKKEVCENISYYKKGCMPDEQTVYNICFLVFSLEPFIFHFRTLFILCGVFPITYGIVSVVCFV